MSFWSRDYYSTYERIRRATPWGNEPPKLKQDEETQMRQDRAEKNKSFSSKKARIKTLEAELKSLNKEVTDLEKELEAYRRLFDPVRRLSIEVLQNIFIYSASRDTSGLRESWNRDSFQITSPPWTASRVCRKWRNAALKLPALWADLIIEFTDRSADKWQSVSILLATYLSRSGNLPLSVSLQSAVFLTSPHPLIPLLVSSASRWTSLTIDILPQNFSLFIPLREFLTSVTTLDFRLDEELITWPADADETGLRLFQDASSLRKLHARSPLVCKFHLPWYSLHRIHLRLLPTSPGKSVRPWHFNVLEKTPNARVCHLEIFAPILPYFDSLKMSQLNELDISAATIDEHSSLDVTNAFEHLILPHIKIFRFSSAAEEEKLVGLKPFLKNSGFMIQTLKIGFPDSTKLLAASVLSVIASTPNLEEFELETCREVVVNKLLEKLIEDEEDYLPHLKTLKLNRAGHYAHRHLIKQLKESGLKVLRT